jgi:hypothetical protein
VKKMTHEQSRRNLARRRRMVAARHGRAGHWGARSRPMLNPGKVSYEIGGNVEATCFGGVAAVHRLVARLGLAEAIDADLELLKVHLPYHESDHVLTMAYNVLCGGTRLQDIERLRHDTAFMNALGAELIPDPTTAGDFCRRFTAADVETLMDAVNAVRPALWGGRGKELLGPVAYLDTDGTIAPTCGEHKAGMDMSYKGIWGYAPLIVTLANTKEVLFLVNRPGNAPSHQNAAAWINKAIDLVLPHAERVCLRGDTDFSLTAHFDRWAERVDFVFGMDANAALRGRAEALDQSCWTRLERPGNPEPSSGQRRRREPNHKQRIVTERGYLNIRLDGEDVAEFAYQPGKCARPYRVIALRKNLTKSRGEQALLDEIKYFFYVTTRTDLSPAQVVACANDRCDQENVIEQLKNGVNALRVPLYDLVSNWAYMVIAALAWNLKSWWAMMLHRKADRREFIAMEFRRFINAVILVPAMVIRRARGITIRILGYHPELAKFFSTWRTIERTAYG